jgi:predicted trehalose synthase
MASKSPRSEAIAGWLGQQRWFAAKNRRIRGVEVVDRIPIDGSTLLIAVVALDDGSTDRYAIPLRDRGEITDALDDPGFGRALVDLIVRAREAPGERGRLRGRPSRVFVPALVPDAPVRRIGGEQSNTSIVLGDVLILKHFRRLADGLNPEAEITAFLTERTGFRNAPRLAGHLEYREGREAATLAVAEELIAGARDGWDWVLGELREHYARVEPVDPVDPARVRELASSTLPALGRLGTRAGELHQALASDPRDPAFAPEPITPADVAAWEGQVERQVAAAREVLGDPASPPVRGIAHGLRGLLDRAKIRHHGDFHLGQTLYRPADGDFVIVDFEGEPLRPIAERRRKHAALRDVAGLLRSIDYAAGTAMPPGLDRWAEAWRAAAATEFVAAYRAATRGAPFVPESDEAFWRAVAVFELEKAAYEVGYEARQRPAWLAIPARGLARAAAAITGPGAAGEA